MLNLKGARGARDSYAHVEDLGVSNYSASVTATVTPADAIQNDIRVYAGLRYEI